MIELESPRNALGSLVRQVLRVALRTLVGLCALCALVGGITAFIAHRLAAHGGHGGLAVVITAALTLAVTPYIAIRGALGAAALQGLGSLGVARRLVGLLFDALSKMESKGELGERGSLAQRGIERLPLGEITRRALAVVGRIAGAGFFAGALRRAMRKLAAASRLEGLRDDDDDGGGVDLVRARERVEALVEARLTFGLRRALTTWMLMLFSILVLGALTAAWLLGR